MQFQILTGSIRWLFLAHVLAGTLALGIFLVPMFSKKGGILHTKTGWIYTFAMALVGTSAIVITPWRMLFDPSRTVDSSDFSAFLFYISVFTLSAISFGLVTLKNKRRQETSRKLAHIGPPILVIVGGVLVQIVGMMHQNPLLIAFPFVGHLTSRRQLQYWLKTPTEKMHWWYAHMNGMFTACIATVTAFLVTAVPRIWPSDLGRSPLLWISPGLILGVILNRWEASYRMKYEGKTE